MKAILALALVLTQAPPWHGTLAQGLAEIGRLSEADKADEALAVADQLLAPDRFARWRESATSHPGWKRTVVEAADPVLAAIGFSELSPAARATIFHARGVVLARAARRAEADEAFEKARALAGPGDLRLDATYDLGWTALTEGEAFRAQIPELGGTPPAPQGAQGAQGAQATPAAPGQPPPPDALDLARAAYLKARGHFVERLTADARDDDTRANVELVQKRLRELAEIQKKREEQKKQQEQDQKDQQQKDQDKKDQDSKDKKDPQKQDKPSDEKDKDSKKPDEQPKPEDKPKDDKKKDEPPKDQPSDQDKKDKDKKEAQPRSAQEQALTKEEVMRILDTLKDREEEGKKLLDQLRRSRRAKVKKDW